MDACVCSDVKKNLSIIMKTIRVLNIDALCITEKDLLQSLDENLAGRGGNGVLITPNLDHLCKLQKDEGFYRCYQQAEWVVCDSKILWLCSKVLKDSFPEPIPGSSFFKHFYKYHKDNHNCRIFLLGARTGVAKEAMHKINEKIGWNIVVGAHSPSFGFEKKPEEIQEISRIVNDSGANVVLVGVGAPKQEKFIINYRSLMPTVKIWMALGATIDFEAGYIKRAPIIFQKLALEWLYRIYCEPKRMFKRYICDDLVFFWYLLKQILGIYKNPFNLE